MREFAISHNISPDIVKIETRIKAIIFDMDGVLINSEPIYVRINHQLYKELGVHITKEEYRGFVGIAADKKWSYIKEKGKLNQTVKELVQMSKDRKVEQLSKSPVLTMDNIYSLLKSLLNSKMRLALASSNNRKAIGIITEKTELKSYFEFLVSGDDIKNGKPAPDIFLKAAAYLNTSPSQCLVFEDARNGLLAAKAAGMYCIGFNSDMAPYPQDFSEADLTIPDYSAASIHKVLEFIDHNSGSNS